MSSKLVQTILRYMFVCHQLPERSFFFRGKQFPICARCTGILFGYLLGIISVFRFGNINFFIVILLMAPLMVDGWSQYYGLWESTNYRRAITGILAGISTIYIINYARIIGTYHGQIIKSLFQ